MKQLQLSPFLCVAAFALAAGGCGGDEPTTPSPTTAAGVGGGSAGTPSTTAGTSAAGTSAAGRSGAAGVGAAGTGTGAAGTGAAGTGAAAAGAGAAGAGAAAGSGGAGAAAGSGGAAAGSGAAAGAGGGAAPGGGTLGGPLMFTGPFTMGTSIPTTNTCPMAVIGGAMGDNKSPALSWTGGPAETKSFALVLFDTGFSLLHWALWDIPATVNMLPEGLASGYELTTPPGAHQATGDMGTDPHAYYGPCSSGSRASMYEYRLYALSADKLMLTESSTGAQAQAAIEAAELEKVVFASKPN